MSKSFKLPFNDLTNYIPSELRNPAVTGLVSNLFNQFMTRDESIPLYGYIGQQPASGDTRAPRVPEATPERDINTIVPVLSFKVGTEQFSFTVQDLVNKAEAIGVSPGTQKWLYSQGNNYVPPIDIDKFTNFFNYYWVAKAVTAVPDLPWNSELLPEYYTIAQPHAADLNKLNVTVATTKTTVLTGTGFNELKFHLVFTSPTTFHVTVDGALGGYGLSTSDFTLNSFDQHFDIYVNHGADTAKLLEFNIVRDEIFDQNGASAGNASFDAGDEFIISATFLSRNYVVNFVGSPGVKGQVTKVKALNSYQVIDGVQLTAGDRVLVKDADPLTSGIFIVSPQTWTKASDFIDDSRVAGAKVWVREGNTQAGHLFTSFSTDPGLIGWTDTGVKDSNTNDWQEGNFWLSGSELSTLGLSRAEAVQAVRPIIEYSGEIQLNSFVKNGVPASSGTVYKQRKTEFNQLPLFDLFRYDGTHSGLVSPVFFYVEDLTAELDIQLQKRVKKSANDSADFTFNHGMIDSDGQLLFVKKGNSLQTVWHAGYIEPTVVDVKQAGEGNGVLSGAVATGFTQQQVWTLIATSETTFSIEGSKMPVLPSPYDTVTVGAQYNNGELSFLITAGDVPFAVGDVFIIRVGNLESARYVYRTDAGIFDLFGGVDKDLAGVGAWQVPRLFYNNPYNESAAEITEGVLYSHFRGILANQVQEQDTDFAFGGSIKLWSEQQTLLASLLMQRDMTPISMIDLAQRQYETALSSVRDIYEQNIAQYLADKGAALNVQDLLAFILQIRSVDNDVRTVLFDSTAALIGFPATLPQLGILPPVQPAIQFDPVLGRTVMLHHDGHESPLYEDTFEFRQQVLGNLSSLQIKRSDGTYTAAVGSLTSYAPALPYKGELWIKPTGELFTLNVISDEAIGPLSANVGEYWYRRNVNELFSWDGDAWIEVQNVLEAWQQVNLAGILNSVILEAETQLYNGINLTARRYDFAPLQADPKFQLQLKNELFSFAALNGYDPLASNYDPADAFTWNYSATSLSTLPTLDVSGAPARWFDMLKSHQRTIAGVIPTERPNAEPWKLFGFATFDTWWASLNSAKQLAYTPYVQVDELDPTKNLGAVRVVKTTSGVTATTGLVVVDGVQLKSGDRILLQHEMSPENNGIWVANANGWSRPSLQFSVGSFVNVTEGTANAGTVWVASAVVNSALTLRQARAWSSEMWADLKALHPTLRLSVNTSTDTLLPPYVSSQVGSSANALTTTMPAGAASAYQFGESSPVETVWNRTLEHGYSLARALFRFDPLAFLGFCWGFNWVEVDGILYDGLDMNMPGHKRFKLHGEALELVARSQLQVSGDETFSLTYSAYDTDRKQSFTISTGGYAQVGVEKTVGASTFTLNDEGRPFRIGDRFDVTNGQAVFVPTPTHKFLGFGQTFTHALRETSINTTSSFAVSAYREWEVNMGYRAGGLVATDDLKVYTESETLSNTAYSLVFKKNAVTENHWIQALRISVIQFGARKISAAGSSPTTDGHDWVFRIEGYNPRYLGLTYFEMDPVHSQVTFNALGKAHTDTVWYEPTIPTAVSTINLPITITGVQNVVTFLYGYQRYLENQGWAFNQLSEFNIDAETGRARNFQLEIEKFVDRCYAGIELNQGHVINPFIDSAWFNQAQGLMSEFIDTSLFDITGHPGVFDALGVKYQKSDLTVNRTGEQSSFSAAGPMFSAHIQLDGFEHLFIFNNYSQPSIDAGLLYDPFSGGRVTTYSFNGRKQASTSLRPEFGGHFLVGNEVRQNIQASTDNIANFYDANRAFENELTTRHALALLGFTPKDYFTNLDISDRTQFNFWRGLVQAKGTQISIDAYLNNDRFDDAQIDEYWAYKVATYGDARQKIFPELKLSVNDAVAQFTQLQFGSDSLTNEGFTTIEPYDEDRWFSLDDMGQDAQFAAELVGTFQNRVQVSDIIKLPFVADKLEAVLGTFELINATTVRVLSVAVADDINFSVLGYGPARPRFNPVKLFNYADAELVSEIPMWHPAAGQHTPTALESINIISNQNPAKYNYSTQVADNNSYDPLRVWGAEQVGRVWLDTRNLAYLPYYDENIFVDRAERLSRWGTLADFATIDVYEWIQSTVPPTEYNALAISQSGNADLNPQTKAAGQVADQQTYVQSRTWAASPVAWSYSPIPLEFQHAAFAASAGPTGAILTLNNGVSYLSTGTFEQFGIQTGMRIGAWDKDPVNPLPLSEYLVQGDLGLTFFSATQNDHFNPTYTLAGILRVKPESTGTGTPFIGQLLFIAVTDSLPIYDANGGIIGQESQYSIKVTEVGSGDSAVFVVSTATTTNIPIVTGQQVIVDASAIGLRLNITLLETASVSAALVRDSVVSLLSADLYALSSVTTSLIIGTALDGQQLSNDDASLNGWRAWNVPTQAQLDADSRQPISSWKPYIGTPVPVPGASLAFVQEAISYFKNPLVLNDGKAISRYLTGWGDWRLLSNSVLTTVNSSHVTAPLVLTHTEFIDAKRTSVYVSGISQLTASYTIVGANLTVLAVPPGAEVTVIIRKYEPTAAELAFNPDVQDNLAYQSHYKQDYQYVALPVRDSNGSLSSSLYFFWVKNKTTTAVGKKQSVQSIAQELRDGPPNFLTFQHLSDAAPYTYDAITISGLSYIVTKDDSFKLRFTRNFTLRDDPEELNLKDTHVEWSLMRPRQKTRVPEALWLKLTDSIAGEDLAGNPIPAVRRVLYDERKGTATSYGFGVEQTLAPAELLRSSVIHAILNTSLVDKTTTLIPVPDYISFLDLDESDTWFADPAAARKTMTDIWNKAKVAQVNEIFFAALEDILASNYALSDVFKTSRISAYSIRVVKENPVVQTYE